ncbi:family 78 glycoside hydrolase catalytic domain [candidate division KSB1 bacterium]|nr:family 78 glycoside hydrolase catalytic domain [candidate division KSB1 bacterium]
MNNTPGFKTRMIAIAIMIFAGFIFNCEDTMKSKIEIKQLQCEYRINPTGVDIEIPHLSWILESALRGQKQTAYQILVASDPELLATGNADLWDSGKIESSQSSHIAYSGKQLASNQAAYWKVRVWDKDGMPSEFSATAKFTMALLHSNDWQAKWISRGESFEPQNKETFYFSPPANIDEIPYDASSTLLRKEIQQSESIKRARIYVSGLGYYKLFVNGQKIGDYELTPAKTHYRKEVLYDTYDVTSLFKQPEIAIGIMLGNGWFNPLKKWWSWRMQWFGAKRALFQLHLDYEDGTSEIICSDETWKTSAGPVISSCIYDGEIYDANREQPGWNQPGFDDSGWEPVTIVQAPGGRMISQMMEPVKITAEIEPVAIKNPKPGVFIVDMGQNFAGWIRLKMKGQRGSKVILRYAENLNKEGLLDVRTNNLAGVTDTYILKGGGEEVFQPNFTFHGFRYVEITGFPGTPDSRDITGCVVHSGCDFTGTFECSNERINHIHRCTQWSQRSNMVGFPSDCPQRDERLGWLGDAHVTAEEAMLNFHTPLFYRNWLNGLRSNQNDAGDIPYISPRPFTDGKGTPAWSSGYLLIVWYHYVHFGDIRILQENYDSMKRYADYLDSTATDYILPMDNYGDWCSASLTGWWHRGEPLSTTTAYYFYNATLVSTVARILGKTADADQYAALTAKIKDAYNRKFFNSKTNQYENGSQFENSFPLLLGIVPEKLKPVILQKVIDDIVSNHEGHLTTGILGTKYMIDMLAREGRNDIAYLLANKTGYPSWDDMLKNRTTISENWNQSGSNNHVMFGSIDTWFYRELAGIRVDESAPGFQKIIIKPFIAPQLSRVEATVKTIKGEVSSKWEFDAGNLDLSIRIPVNITAQVYIPAIDTASITEGNVLAVDAEGVRFNQLADNQAVFDVGSGSYHFKSKGISHLITKAFAEAPKITPQNAFIRIPETAVINIESPVAGAEVRYTLDSSQPDRGSLLYEKPFELKKNAIVTARVFKEGYQPGFCAISEITFVDPEVNGLDVALYEGEWVKLPDFNALTPKTSRSVWHIGLDEIELPKYNFALVFKGFIEIAQPGEYKFYTTSNDGSRLFINGKLVVENDGEHGAEERSGSIALKVGKHPIEVHYFQSGGSTALEASFEGPGIEKQCIPAHLLFKRGE